MGEEVRYSIIVQPFGIRTSNVVAGMNKTFPGRFTESESIIPNKNS